MMMRNKPTVTGMSSPAKRHTAGGEAPAGGWEIRPCGMLVQQRNSDANQSPIPIPTIKIKVKYEYSYLDITISSQSSFGELKKMLSGLTGLHIQDQKLIFKDRERDSKSFLDVVGVKNGSKLVLIEDEISRERRRLELRRSQSMDRASRAIAEISMEVDKIAKQVANLELEIFGGKKVDERLVLTVIELLMTQLIKLDGVIADGDVKLQRRMQVRRVQKYIEFLDVLKMRNSMLGSHGIPKAQFYHQQEKNSRGQMPMTMSNNNLQEQMRHRNPAGPVVVTTKWETFDSNLASKSPLISTSTTLNRTSKINGRF